MGAAPDLRGNQIFVSAYLVWIDFPVVIDVKHRKEAIRVLLHLVERQLAIVIAVSLSKPVNKRVVLAPIRAKRLAHRTDENAAMPRSRNDDGGGGRTGEDLGGGRREGED